MFQYSRFRNELPASSHTPFLRFPNGVTTGSNPVAPQTTEQDKWQFRDDFSWSVAGLGGIAHDFKAGVNWIHEPRLFISTTAGADGQFTMGANDLNGPVTLVTAIGGATAVNTPFDFYGLYVKDDWRVTNRLTLNLGLRWDYVAGMPIDQSRNPNFVTLQAAGLAGRFAGTALDAFGQAPRGEFPVACDRCRRRERARLQRAEPGRHPQGRRHALQRRRPAGVDCPPQYRQYQPAAAGRRGTLTAPRAALHPAVESRLGAPA